MFLPCFSWNEGSIYPLAMPPSLPPGHQSLYETPLSLPKLLHALTEGQECGLFTGIDHIPLLNRKEESHNMTSHRSYIGTKGK